MCMHTLLFAVSLQCHVACAQHVCSQLWVARHASNRGHLPATIQGRHAQPTVLAVDISELATAKKGKNVYEVVHKDTSGMVQSCHKVFAVHMCM